MFYVSFQHPGYMTKAEEGEKEVVFSPSPIRQMARSLKSWTERA